MLAPFVIPFYCAFTPKQGRRWHYFLVFTASAYCLAFPFFKPLWCQYWQGTIDYIDSIKQPHDLVAVYTPYSAYSFAFAYNRAINFELKPGQAPQCHQAYDPHKPGVFMLTPNLIGDVLPKSLGSTRIILILCQDQTFGDGTLLPMLAQFYDIVPGYRFESIWGWAGVRCCILTPRQVNLP